MQALAVAGRAVLVAQVELKSADDHLDRQGSEVALPLGDAAGDAVLRDPLGEASRVGPELACAPLQRDLSHDVPARRLRVARAGSNERAV